MKIKYYLRGLGTGILFATIILIISNATKNDNITTETTTQTTTQITTEIVTETSAEEVSTEELEATTEETTQETTGDTGSINSEIKTITVSSGMSSEQVAGMLQSNGIIENATDFDTYLKEYGYSKIISVGKYEISANSTYKEIAEIITNTN